MADATPPHPPSPAAAAKHGKNFLKGRPKWQYIAAAVVFVGVAYLYWRKTHSGDGGADTMTDPNAMDGTVDYGPMAAGGMGGGYVAAAPTQGAFGGFDAPLDTRGPEGQQPEAVGSDDPSPAPVQIFLPGASPTSTPAPVPADSSDLADLETFPTVKVSPAAAAPAKPATPMKKIALPTGGGTSMPRTVANHLIPQAVLAPFRSDAYKSTPAGVFGGVPYAAGGVPLAAPTAESVMETHSLIGTALQPLPDVAPPGYPHKGPHGWYRIERDPGSHRQYHLYTSGLKVWL